MKTNLKSCLVCLFLGVFVALPLSVQAQSPQPDTWSAFVESTDNSSVIDTFFLQTFQGETTGKNNWNYKIDGTAEIKDISNLTGYDDHGTTALNIKANTTVSFNEYNLGANTFDSAHIAIRWLEFFQDGESFNISFKQGGATQTNKAPNVASSNNPNTFGRYLITQNPVKIEIITPSTLSSKSYLLLDSVMAYGYNRQYTLFKGSGDWADNACWSHHPARKSNTALIQGHASLQSNRTTKAVQISGGSLKINDGSTLQTNELTLYDTENSHASLTVLGGLEVNEELIVEKTFPDKGKWYFFSLPFDVYAEDIENFSFKDDTETGSGNYFYLQTYDSEQRANGEKGWKVVSASLSADQPIIHKHQGYLIALDEAANTTTLRFHCPNEQIPNEFGKSVSVTLYATTGGNESDNGWVLCGNPLPTPLPLRNIIETEGLDGYIYLYQNGDYQAYPIDSDYAIAPYTAFFIKAADETVLEVTVPTEVVSSARLLACNSPLRASQEPAGNPTSNQTMGETDNVRIVQEPHQIRIEHLPETGIAQWLNVKGQVISTAVIPSGHSTLRYPTTPGFYLLHLRYGKHEQVVKHVR